MKISGKYNTIQNNLALLTILPILFITAIGYNFYMNRDISRLSEELIYESRAYSKLLSQDFVKMIAIGDIDQAADITSRLRGHEMIQSVTLYNNQDTPVFGYRKKDFTEVVRKPRNWQRQPEISGASLHLLEPVTYKDVDYGHVYLQVSTKKIQDIRASYMQQGMVLGLALLIACLVMIMAIRHYFTRPILQMVEALKHIGETQDYSTRFNVERNDEIGLLFDGINNMQRQIERANKSLTDQQHALNQQAIVSVTDTEGNIIYINDKFIEISGYDRDELVGQNHRILNSYTHDGGFFRDMYRTITNGDVWHSDICNQAKDGHLYWVHATIVPTLDEEGRPKNFISMQSDITQHRMTNKALRVSEERLGMAMSVANDGIWDWRLDDDSVFFDSRYYTMAGYEPYEFPCSFEEWEKHVHPDDIEAARKAIEQYLSGLSKTFDTDFRFLTKENNYIWIRSRGKSVEWGEDGKPLRFVGTHTDITQRKQAEQASLESERRFRSLVEYSPMGIFETDKEGQCLYVNNKWLEIAGLTLEEALGEGWKRALDESDRKRIDKLWSDNAQSDKPWDMEYRFCKPEGKISWVMGRTLALRDESGQITGYLGVNVDVTDRKQTEDALRRSQKLDAIGQLTGGITHDFNNILGIIMGNIHLLERYIGGDEKTQKRIDTIKQAGQRAADLTRSLLSFSRSEATSIVSTNINQLIEHMQNLIKHSLTPQVEVEYQFDEELWNTEIEAGDFEDTLLNLVINARDAMDGSGHLIIETHNRTLDADYCDSIPDITPGDYVELAVSDTGKGMSIDLQERIFEPFFTTKATGKGTGLGLAMVFGFVNRSRGNITVYSEKDIGTTFRLYIPRALKAQSGESIEDKREERTEEPTGGQETILIVDDEEALLELVEESLYSLGYNVLCAHDAQQALDVLAEKPGIDMLFSDVVMPGMNGYELAEKVKSLYPEIKVLLTSGYTEKVAIKSGQVKFNANLLSKPYSQNDLAHHVRNTLMDKMV